MELVTFIKQLRETGTITLAPGVESPATLRAAQDAIEPQLRDMDRIARLDAPGEPPPFSPLAATWSALTLYEACRCLVFRDMGEEAVRERLSVPCPEALSPEVVWSVDLAMRHLPDLFSLARGLAEDDCLVEELRRIGRDWPFSSVGMRKVGPVNNRPILAAPSLRTLYVDRIIDREDLARLDFPAVAEAVHAALGIYGHELAPTIQRRLDELAQATQAPGEPRTPA